MDAKAAKQAAVDEAVADIVKALNDAGIETRASCSGHGRRAGNIALASGRMLDILPDYETWENHNDTCKHKMFATDIHGKQRRIEISEARVIEFGDYVGIEQHGGEMYQHKVIGRFKSNTYVTVPVKIPREEAHGGECVEVVACITCGISETEVLKYRVEDVKVGKVKYAAFEHIAKAKGE